MQTAPVRLVRPSNPPDNSVFAPFKESQFPPPILLDYQLSRRQYSTAWHDMSFSRRSRRSPRAYQGTPGVTVPLATCVYCLVPCRAGGQQDGKGRKQGRAEKPGVADATGACTGLSL